MKSIPMRRKEHNRGLRQPESLRDLSYYDMQNNGAIEEAFREAMNYPSLSKLGKLRTAPLRTLAAKGLSLIGARTGLNFSLHARTFWGGEMLVRVPEPVSQQLLCCGLFEPNVTAYMLKILKPGDTFLDVGAHFGYFTLLGAWLTGERGQVHSFEPTPNTFRVLIRNVGLNTTVTANQLAVWSRPQELLINDFGSHLSAFNSVFSPRLDDSGRGSRRSDAIPVAAVSLDDYCADRGVVPQFVKIDAESAEQEIIDGMSRLLVEDRPSISIEVGDFDLKGVHRSADILQRVIDQGYIAHELRGERIMLHRLRENYGYDNILLVPHENAHVLDGQNT